MAQTSTRVVFGSLSSEEEQRLFKEVRELFPDAEATQFIQLSAEPPAWVRIIADVLTWETVLKVAATAYLTQLGKHLADSSWDARKKVRPLVIQAAGAAVTSLKTVYTAFRHTRERLGRRLGVHALLPWPHHWGTGLPLDVEDEGEFIESLALFVSRIGGIERATAHLRDGGCRPLGGVTCELTEKGFTLVWVDQADNLLYQQEFDSDGVAAREGSTRPYQEPPGLQ